MYSVGSITVESESPSSFPSRKSQPQQGITSSLQGATS